MFSPKNLTGYQKYIGQHGTTTKSGCGFYISNNITFIPRKDLDTHFYNQINEYSCKWIEIINKNKTNIVMASTYRHPSKNYDDFLEYIMLTGDFNYNLLNYDKNKHINKFLDIMLTYCCQPHILYPTRIVNNATPSLVDNIFFNNIENNSVSGNLTCKLTDHMPNFLIYQKFNKSVKKTSIKKRDFSKFKEDFIFDLNEINLCHKIKNVESTNDKFNFLNDNIIKIFNIHAPIKTLSNRETKNLLTLQRLVLGPRQIVCYLSRKRLVCLC